MGAAHFQYAVPASPDSVPNSTTPRESNTWQFPIAQLSFGSRFWMLALGGDCTVQLWGFEPTVQRWFSIVSPASLVEDTLFLFDISAVPLGVPLFAQVTVVGTASRILGGLMEN